MSIIYVKNCASCSCEVTITSQRILREKATPMHKHVINGASHCHSVCIYSFDLCVFYYKPKL